MLHVQLLRSWSQTKDPRMRAIKHPSSVQQLNPIDEHDVQGNGLISDLHYIFIDT